MNFLRTRKRIGIDNSHDLPRLCKSFETQETAGTPPISIAKGKTYTSFSPPDFFFGCSLNDENTVATQATQRTVVVAGFITGRNHEVALANCMFTSPAVEVAPVPMLHEVLPKTFLQKLVSFTMIQTDPEVSTLLVDDSRLI